MTGERDWRRPLSAEQVQLRVAILAGLGLVMFVVIFLRLWYLEILSGDKYLAQAENNQVRELIVQAPRGIITDRNGEPLVTNRTALELQVKPNELPETLERRRRLFERLSPLVGIEPAKIRKRIRAELEEAPGSVVSLKRDIAYDSVYYLRENQAKFPGVSVERVYVRQYPQASLAAHVLGFVREADEEDLENPENETLRPGDQIGKGGVELAYDSLLRGINGATRVQVDASGGTTGRRLAVREPVQGNDLVLSIDSGVQRAADGAIGSFGLPAAFVAMNVRNGELLAIGSQPSYDPSLLARPQISEGVAKAIFGDPEAEGATDVPVLNRAIGGEYPTGSTFKPFTALAALDSGKLGIEEIINDDGEFPTGDGRVLHNAGNKAYGPINLRKALEVSSDVFFYTLGARMNEAEGDSAPIQEWARAFGFGAATGLDFAAEETGRVPTPDEQNELYAENTAPDSACGKEVCVEGGEVTDRPWSIGDNINLAVGQGSFLATPLQMAVAYGALANGGELVEPHVGLRVEDSAGRTVQVIEPPPQGEVEIRERDRQVVIDGLRAAAMEPNGTSYHIFGGYPVDVAGKTGTAETFFNGVPYDQSWYVALAPYDDPKYVVAVTVERGGFGADAAAPAAQTILNEVLGVKPEKIEQVSSTGGVFE